MDGTRQGPVLRLGPLRAPAEAGGGGGEEGLPAEAVAWGFRLLAGRDPLNEAEFAAFRALPDLDAMRRAFANVTEFHAFFDTVLTPAPNWRMPLFLLRPPAVPGLDWRFVPPDLDNPTCQLRTAAQLADPVFAEIAEAMGLPPARAAAHWEEIWAVSVLATAGLVAPGRRGLHLSGPPGRAAAVLASRGVAILSASADPAPGGAEADRLGLFHPEVIDLPVFEELVRAAHLPDPARPAMLGEDGFDFCWSLDLPGRLGSVAAALDAFEASLEVLRPGGLALHACRLNLSSDAATWEFPGLTLLRRSDIEALAARLMAAGHALLPLNTHPGIDPADEEVSVAPGAPAAHRHRNGVLVSAAFGLAIRKAG